MEKEVELEKAKYDLIWRDFPGYRDCSPGEVFSPLFFEGFAKDIRPGQTITDFGCGTARVAKEFLNKELNTMLVDISPHCLDQDIRNLLTLFSNQIRFVQACMWQLPEDLEPTHWIYCCDVLEHIPEGWVETVLEQMASRMLFGGYFSICLQEDLMGRQIGCPLHLTVKQRSFWEEKISSYFTIDAQDVLIDDLYFNCRVLAKNDQKISGA